MSHPTRRNLLQAAGLGALAATLGLSACSTRAPAADAADAPSSGDASGTVTVTDQYGTTIELDGPVERIASAIIPVPSMIIAADRGADRITGINQVAAKFAQNGFLATMFPELLQTSVIAGQDFVPNVEEILKGNPDVVIQWGDKGDDIVEPLRAAGLPTILLRYGTQEDLEAWVTIFGDLLGTQDKAQRILDTFESDRALVARTVAGRAKPRTLHLYNAAEQTAASAAGSYMDYWIELAGGTNVAKDAGQGTTVEITQEQVLAWDPEVVTLGNFDPMTPADFMADPRWSTLSAVKNKRVHKVPNGGFAWDPPCNESNLMWQWAATVYHDGVDLGLRDKIRTTFDDLYGYEMSDADIDKVLHAESNAGSARWEVLSA
ncbi:ABC transporter substrate-binding protein [Xylanimonas ulmi]|uniref:Iron complex transport system substrate-binding protein n=1 Tax=Xylanimonas ulmi TaxID=228973 RepID=A0A4Q7M6B6_9MICO|nr:ABC transporter substrate-binding protein [Xylanibacterium ulmi]RZS62587.1 iron complex transport system substrate-binding protein [Xylanibacterium ulmi]